MDKNLSTIIFDMKKKLEISIEHARYLHKIWIEEESLIIALKQQIATLESL
jgi:hypothetical protein